MTTKTSLLIFGFINENELTSLKESCNNIIHLAKRIIYFVEANFRTNKLFRYLLFLRMKGVNLNKFFDAVIEEEEKKKP